MKSLSIVYPNGTKIAKGEKTIEVRSWIPQLESNEDLLIVENKKFLNTDGDSDIGNPVAIVRVKNIRDYQESDMARACASRWEPGYYSWELSHIRPVKTDKVILASRGIYEVEFEPDNTESETWKPLNLNELHSLLNPLSNNFWIAGGLAIDLFLGKETRLHSDIDVAINRNAQILFQKKLLNWDLQACDPPGSGKLRSWKKDEILPSNIHNIWCRKNENAPWSLELLLCDFEADEWVYRRNKKIRGPISEFGWKHEVGFQVISPEIQLLYKSKNPRPKDFDDFKNCYRKLNQNKLAWLKEMITYESGSNHPWLEY
jgi:hypothetical protein